MNTKRLLLMVAAGSLGMLGHASAQEVTITYSIKWELQDPVFPGVPNKGEVWATISPEMGTVIPWTTAPGKGQPGKLLAFSSSVFDTLNVSNGQMGTLKWTVPPEFNLAGIPGVPDGNGGIQGTTSKQTVGLPPNPNLDQSVKILDLVWTGVVPGNGELIDYQISAASANVYLDIGQVGPVYVIHKAKFINGGGSFYYGTPAPGTLAIGGLALALVSRRRRSPVTSAELRAHTQEASS